jgi:hypothetical protein
MGLQIWGSPETPLLYDGAFNRNRGRNISKHWKMIPANSVGQTQSIQVSSREINFPEIFGKPFRNDFYCFGTDNIVQECITTICNIHKSSRTETYYDK